MHRDLKPANIGFSPDNELKLFDFGFAVVLEPSSRLPNGRYNLEKGKGTCRYMAPEVAKLQPYNELADVYSFGIVLWEVLALEKPYQTFTIEEWAKKVIVDGARPKLNETWPDEIQRLLAYCWSEDLNKRPTFDVVIDVLEDLVNIEHFDFQ